MTLATDLLIGVAVGILVEVGLHWWHGMPIRHVLRPEVEVVEAGEAVTLRVAQAAVFSNFLTIKRHLAEVPAGRAVVVDLSGTRLVDHTVMERLHELMDEWNLSGRQLEDPRRPRLALEVVRLLEPPQRLEAPHEHLAAVRVHAHLVAVVHADREVHQLSLVVRVGDLMRHAGPRRARPVSRRTGPGRPGWTARGRPSGLRRPGR